MSFLTPRARLALFLPLLTLLASPFDARAQKLSEVVAHHAGSDDHEYVELFGSPSTSYAALRILVVDGGAAPGRIQSVFTPGTTNGAGFWTTGFLTSTLEGGTLTFLLVSGFTGNVGDDVDTNDDGTLDTAPWSALLDSVALTDGAPGARTYSPAVLGPSFDGLGVAPGGASRYPYFLDTDSASDWKRNDFDGEGLPGFTGTLAPGEAINTPAWPTRVHDADTWGSVDTSSSAVLRTTLHDAIKGHVRFDYTASATDTWDILNAADEDPRDTTKVLDIYKNERYAKIPGGTGPYNREHSWPNSYGFPVTTMIPYTDCHHLFVSEVGFNADRGNKPYGTCSAGCSEDPTTANFGFGGGSGVYPGNSNWYSNGGNVWETWNHRRGDVARAQLYLDVRYEGGTHVVTGAFEPDLVLTDNTSLIVAKTATAASPQAYMGLLTAILAWHAQDPPDDDERMRNDVVASYQGNRNPFVDHPEWTACLFQGIGCAPRLADAATIDTSLGATGALRHLSTSPRTATSWTWEVLARPAGSTAALSSTAIRNPTFTPDQPGSYTFRLTAGNGAATNVTTISLTTAGAVSGPRLYTLAPCRVLDTRNPDGPLGGPVLATGEDRLFPMTSACGVPPTARALSVNLTVTQPAAAGSLKLRAGDEAVTTATAISFGAGQTLANNALLKLATNGAGTAGIKNESGGTVHVIVDVNGYFQ